MNVRTLTAALALASSALLFAPHAASQNKAVAESLFKAAKELMKKGNYAEACPKLVESQKQEPAVGTLVNLGKCYEGLGKTTSAWSEYKNAVALAKKLGDSEREKAARDLVTDIEPKLPKLQVNSPGNTGISGLVLQEDGVDVGGAAIGTAMFIDPGEHKIEVSAPGYEMWTATVVVKPSGVTEVTVPPLVKKPETAPTASVTAAPTVTGMPSVTATTTGAPTTSSTGDTPPPGGGSGMKTAGIVVGAIGVVGIGVGAVFGGLAASDVGKATSDPSLCPDKVCTPAGRAFINDASTKATISSIALPVGIVAAGAGLVLILIAPSSSPSTGNKPSSLAVVPSAGPDGGGVHVFGRF